MADAPMHSGPTLEVNLAALVRNYLVLRNKFLEISSPLTGEGQGGGDETIPPSLILPRKGGGNEAKRCAAVVKANAYGLGVGEVAPALYNAGCRDFFVATLEEGLELRRILEPEDEPRILFTDARIYVFHGVRKGQAKEFTHHRILPVLNSPEQIGHWNSAGPAALHIDTGMTRLGLTLGEAKKLHPSPSGFELIMSHLACANEPENPMNRKQLMEFKEALAYFPGTAASLANSSGIFLGQDYHFQLARPGCSLYGISPNTTAPNPMENVATLSAPVLQYRHISNSQTVGYGATAIAPAGSVLATVELGYADGFLRSLSTKTRGFAAGVRVPVLGRVSMDMVVVDVSAVPAPLRTPDMRITFIDKQQPVDVIAKDAGTIGYEILTRIGARVKRIYGNS